MALVLRRGRTVDRASPEQPPPPAPRGRLIRAVAVLAAVLVGGTAGALAFDQATRDHLLPGTLIGGVPVGGRSLAEARTELERVFAGPLRDPIELVAEDGSVTTTPWELGLRVDVDEVLRDTHRQQQALPFGRRTLRRVVFDRSDIAVGRLVDADRLNGAVATAAEQLERPVRDASVEVEDGKLELIPHQVGQEVDAEAAPTAIVDALYDGERRVRLPVHLTQPELRTEAFKQVILVRTVDNTLDLYEDGEIERQYRVATGTGGHPTPKGQFTIVAKKKYPGWTNPNQPWSAGMPAYIPPGPNNPLGTRALYLDVSGIRVHGTPQAWSIGSNASHGCIRMHMREAEELYELVDVGTPILIVRT